jgi:hypothetical protein
MTPSHIPPAPDDYTLHVARNRAEVETMRPAWQQMQWHPNADIDYFLTIIASRRELIRPHVILVSRNGTPQAMLIGRIAEFAIRDRLIPVMFQRPVARSLEIVHGGVLGDPSHSLCAVLLDAAEATFAEHEADVIFLSHVDTASRFHDAAVAKAPFLCRDHFRTSAITRITTLSESYAEFLSARSKNTRRNLRRHSSLIPARFPDRWSIHCYSRPDDVQRLIEDAEHIAANTYHRGLGTGFRPDAETHAVLTLAADRHWLRAYVLYIDGAPRAFWNGIIYQRTFHTWTTGYHPDYAGYHPGTFLLAHIFNDLCGNDDVQQIDFGHGDAQYKRSYCDIERREACIYIFAPTVSGFALNAARSAATLAREGARSALKATHLWSTARRKWRSHLQRRAA